MSVPMLKKKVNFEWRKGLHYLSLLWGIALMFHAPQRIFWLIGAPFSIYIVDKIFKIFQTTHLVENAHFQRLGDTSCIISFKNPSGFEMQNTAYVYLMLPWLSRYQFHAFTVFPCIKPGHSSICVSKCGDWTESLMKEITTPMHKPAFVVGPFISPFSSPAMDKENLLTVASGIGVAPAISLIKQYASTNRRLNLVWICRDGGLIEHFLSNVHFSNSGYTLIYYTGKRSLVIHDNLAPNVFIFNGRPNLEKTLSGIVDSIVSNNGLPEKLYHKQKTISKTPAALRTQPLLERALSIYNIEQLFENAVKASIIEGEEESEAALIHRASYYGIQQTMIQLLGDSFELVVDKIRENFEEVDTDGSWTLDKNNFEAFVGLMLLNKDDDGKRITCTDTCKVKNIFDPQHDSAMRFGIRKVLQGDDRFCAKHWNMLYCGGSEPILAQLRAFKKKYGIDLSVEKFDW